MSNHDLTPQTPFSLDVQVIEGEPRVLDIDLAKQLGMAKPEDIRRTIKANHEELEAFGIIARAAINAGQRGKPGTAFYPNRAQALLLCILSKTPRGKEVRAEVIRRFEMVEALQAQPQALGMEHMVAAVTALTQTVQGLVQSLASKPQVAAPEVPLEVAPQAPRKAARRVNEDREGKYEAVTYGRGRGHSPTFSRDDISLVLALSKRGSTDADIMRATGLSRRVVQNLRTRPNEASETLRRWGR